MAVLVKNFSYNGLQPANIYVKIDRVAGGKDDGCWEANLSSYASAEARNNGTDRLLQFKLEPNAPYIEGEHPFKSVYDFYKLGMQSKGYIVEDI